MQVPDLLKSVRSIATLALVLTYCHLAVNGKVTAENFTTAVMMALGFYFVLKKHPEDKNGGKNGGNSESPPVH